MKRQLRDRLHAASHAKLAQSIVLDSKNSDNSIIYQLEDLANDQQIINTHVQNNKVSSFNANQIECNFSSPKITYRNFKKISEDSIMPDDIQVHTQRKNKHKLNTEYNEKQINYQTLFQRRQRMSQKKSFHKQFPTLEAKTQNNNIFKVKYEINKSKIMKNKKVIYENILDKCQHCGFIKSEIIDSNIVCSNQTCRILRMHQKKEAFSLMGVLLQAESSSATQEQLDDLINKIKQQIHKVEEWLSYLNCLSHQIDNIKKSKKQFQKYNKDIIKNLAAQLVAMKPRKSIQDKFEYQNSKKMIQNINFGPIYNELKKWKSINMSKLEANKKIQQLIQKYKPLCLKKFVNEIAEQMACVSDNFSSNPLHLKVSQQISYSFQGNLKQLVLIVDSSMQLRRQNFLLIQKLNCLKLIFQCRKTSRQLRQLFNILPHCIKLIIEFDYKLNSHVSSENFPLLSKSSEIAQQQLYINVSNARHEILDDLMQASKLITVKNKITMNVTINSHIQQHEWSAYAKSKQWGTKVIKNFIKNIGNKLSHFRMSLPLRVNEQEISQYILNSDYSQLIDFKLVTIQANGDKSNKLSTLLHQIVSKKKSLMYQLVNRTKYESHPLHFKAKLAQSVYKVLF